MNGIGYFRRWREKYIRLVRILRAMTYGAETRGLTKPVERKVRPVQRDLERRMIGVTPRDKKLERLGLGNEHLGRHYSSN